ncbi:hypothetical protein ACFRFQ_25270 [Rhodococcus sp. NPDC056743]|uniref:hypothetical protein n=1 Tax=Rhodococcus sp. NPDC056743 TaxID=3345934 RepID=UPI0036710665
MADESSTTEPAAFYERRGSIAIFTLSRPRALNSVNGELVTAADNLIEQTHSDADIRVVTGT